MKTIMKKNHVVAIVMIAATLVFTVSCKKENLNEPASLSAANSQDMSRQTAFSPWQKRSSGVSAPHRGIIEMSTFGQATCYGLMYNESGEPPYQDVSITHNGGATWQVKSKHKLENNYLFGVAATSSNTVHVVGWNYVDGGGNVFRSSDGGASWKREAANAFTHPESFPNAIQFFNPKDGIMLGDPQDGYFENYITHDGGNSWKRVPSKRIPAPQKNEYGWTYTTDIYNNTIWTLTIKHDDDYNIVNARLFQSDDKGENWYVRNSSMPVTYGDVTMKFRNRSVGLIKNNGTLYRTTDGGTTWKEVNYSGTWFSFDFDNIPGLPGWWISTGGGYPTDDPRSIYGFGSSISYDDGNHWVTLDTTVNHTNADMTGPLHGYSGGITTGSGDDGVFVYSFLQSRLNSVVSAGNALTNNQKVNVPKPSGNVFLPGNKFAALRHHKYR
jgi:photosystem II stability/assembly factor-like uncharacterized protein